MLETPIDQTLPTTTPISEASEAAHGQGRIHRDLRSDGARDCL